MHHIARLTQYFVSPANMHTTGRDKIASVLSLLLHTGSMLSYVLSGPVRYGLSAWLAVHNHEQERRLHPCTARGITLGTVALTDRHKTPAKWARSGVPALWSAVHKSNKLRVRNVDQELKSHPCTFGIITRGTVALTY